MLAAKKPEKQQFHQLKCSFERNRCTHIYPTPPLGQVMTQGQFF